MTTLLAIETSQRAGSVALRRDRSSLTEPLRGRHDEDLIAGIDRVLRRADASRAALEAVAVSVGPGGFTGLRVGIATAKMLGLALAIPLVSVPTALVVAESVTPQQCRGRALLVALAVKDERFWATRLGHEAGTWRIEGTPGLLAADDARFADADGAGASSGAIGGVAGDRFLPGPVRRRAEDAGVAIIEPNFDAAACAAVAGRMLATGETTSPASVTPIYARPPEVTIRT